MSRAVFPLAVVLLLIISLSLVEGMMRDRWASSGIQAAELGKRFDQVPHKLGDWQGEDLSVDEETKSTAGAVGYVSRRYVNSVTGGAVRIWLIVGHSRDIWRHTPDICYPNQGFREVGGQLKHHMPVPGEEAAVFYTAKYSKEDPTGRHVERVFWAWNHPDTDLWEAPDSARAHYGLARALFKLYFVSSVGRDENTIDGNASVEFAELMLPALNAALFPEEGVETLEAAAVAAAAVAAEAVDPGTESEQAAQ